VSTEAAQFFFAILTLLAGAGSLAIIGLRVATRWSDGAREWLGDIHAAAVWLAFAVALTSTLGSLYFSEVADFIPCKLCWFQRIAMYPLSAILLVGAIRRDRAVRWYVAPIALVGAGVAAYHYLIEWRPELDSGACNLFGPSCTDTWFREFGFISLALMSLVGFVTILTLLFVPIPATLGESDAAESVPTTT
jgi:disulfide bond formation protein DsbB